MNIEETRAFNLLVAFRRDIGPTQCGGMFKKIKKNVFKLKS
jgi:hypothetical protein